MSVLPVNLIFGGVQRDGHWAGMPTLVVAIMPHPEAAPAGDVAGLPIPEWDFDPVNEVTLTKLMSRNSGCNSPHFASVAPLRLFNVAKGYRERHVLLIGRDAGRHDLAEITTMLIDSGRSVQIETTDMRGCQGVDNAWLTLLTLPSQSTEAEAHEAGRRPDEVVANIRWRADLERTDLLYADTCPLVWLRPSPLADPRMYWNCLAVAVKRGWRVLGPAANL